MSQEDRGPVRDGPDDVPGGDRPPVPGRAGPGPGPTLRPGAGDAASAGAAAEPAPGLADELAGIDLAAIEREERYASRRLASIEAGRRKAGAAGAAMAGIMVTLHEIYEGPLRDEIVAEIEASGEPGDIDTDGIEMRVGEIDLWAPPPPDDP